MAVQVSSDEIIAQIDAIVIDGGKMSFEEESSQESDVGESASTVTIVEAEEEKRSISDVAEDVRSAVRSTPITAEDVGDAVRSTPITAEDVGGAVRSTPTTADDVGGAVRSTHNTDKAEDVGEATRSVPKTDTVGKAEDSGDPKVVKARKPGARIGGIYFPPKEERMGGRYSEDEFRRMRRDGRTPWFLSRGAREEATKRILNQVWRRYGEKVPKEIEKELADVE